MAETFKARYWKMNGAGNEIVVLDLRDAPGRLDSNSAEAIAGSGVTRCDQLMVLHPVESPGTDAKIIIFNTDGSPAGACGNGMRCVTLVLHEETGATDFLLETVSGQLACHFESAAAISIDMGRPKFDWTEIPLAKAADDTRSVALDDATSGEPPLRNPSVVNMGNPHAVFWVDDLDLVDIKEVGPRLETHALFPDRANITLAHVISPTEIEIVTWERGAGLTQACGSAACATAVSAARTERSAREVTVRVPGGIIHIAWRDDDHVVMTGPAVHEHQGHVTFDRVDGTTLTVSSVVPIGDQPNAA